MRITALGDSAIVVTFAGGIDPEVNERVLQLAEQIRDAGPQGITFVAPSYTSLTIGFDPLSTTTNTLQEVISGMAATPESSALRDANTWVIPVCYDEQFALDLDDVCATTEMSWREIVAAHMSRTYRVYMIGFLPGFPYLGVLPGKLRLPRKETPRMRIPPGSVAIAADQTAIYPFESPGGWHILGRTPVPLIQRDVKAPFTIQPGDQMRFTRMTVKEFEQTSHALTHGKLTINSFRED